MTDTDGTLNKTYNEIVTAAESKVVMYKYTYDDGDDVGTVYCRFYMSEVYNNEEFIVYFRDIYASGEPSFTASSADGYPVRDP